MYRNNSNVCNMVEMCTASSQTLTWVHCFCEKPTWLLTPVGVQVPNGAAGFYLLGKICRLTNRHKVAQSYHKAALTLDPLLWSAYEELCMLGMCCSRLLHVNHACMQAMT